MDDAAAGLPEALIVPPARSHVGTLVFLHDFTGSGERMSQRWVPALRQRLGAEIELLRLVFLNAPLRSISCYGTSRQVHHAWHDYFSNHGGDEGRPEVEEEIDEKHVAWSREQIHLCIDAEAALLDGDYGRVAVIGASQGACMALDVALTLPGARRLAGTYASYGHVYSCTEAAAAAAPDVSEETARKAIVVHAFHGARDRVIAASLALRTYASLLDNGIELRLRIEPALAHIERSETEFDFFCESLVSWQLLEKRPLSPCLPLVSATGDAPMSKSVEGRWLLKRRLQVSREVEWTVGSMGMDATVVVREVAATNELRLNECELPLNECADKPGVRKGPFVCFRHRKWAYWGGGMQQLAPAREKAIVVAYSTACGGVPRASLAMGPTAATARIAAATFLISVVSASVVRALHRRE
mmetsp:Transcript_56648/g.93646  ORF Transcript_56648/g.93646 Transcript_56648/m.93646 type:complete len:415 (-) Transcript_56648:104-1348(-)|eukprot:CAMPEP_0119330814 /NCGR_PEP_ID=MMETSP1333-20130426/79081_1 /TAXON_ID=418940 /ORGANISM="Scyphosphaera apsteinii, Strain RCC1455" /LENGTH=414 /DNA_ID=CAMNT_0007340279 /DNA_START=77 /DNA_END=1321 /DNA_ORIENTATION=-